MRNKVVAFSYNFQEMFFSKDIFLLPYYLGREIKEDCIYLYIKNQGNADIPNHHKNIQLIKSSTSNELLTILRCVTLHSLHIDVLFINGSSAVHMFAVWIYKHINRKGKVVVFGDMEKSLAEEFNRNEFRYSGGVFGWIKGKLTEFFFNHVTYLVANTEAYTIMNDLCQRKHWKGLLHFYPCLDDEKFKEYGLTRNTWTEKENVIVCVGRIGNHQKNTEMLIDALKKVDLKDWKIYMIGPVTSSFDLNEQGDFQKVIDQFFLDYPQYKDKLIFTGMIYDQKEVFEYYNLAKVLLVTSRHEGFANVYSQAAALGCYIISTDVGGADVASNNWQFGTRLEQEDSGGLALVLTNLVDGKIAIDEAESLTFEEMSYSKRVHDVLFPKIQSMSYEEGCKGEATIRAQE